MFSNSDVRQKSRCYRCSHEFVKVEGENVCSRCGSELFPSLAQLQTPVNAGSVIGSCSTGQTLQPLSNLIDPTLPLPSFTSHVLPPFRALPPLSIPPNNTSSFLPNSANSLPFPQLPPPPLAQINELNGFPKQSLPMNNNVNNMNLNLNNSISMSNGHRPVNINIQNNNENMNNHPQNVNNNSNFQSESNANKAANGSTPSNNTARRVNTASGNEITVNVESNNYNINNNNINTSNNAQTPNNNPNTTTSSNNNANILPNHQRILQTVHLQHIQNLIEIQRTMHLQNPPYPHSHSPDIARIVNEINTVMHNHSLQHFQALSSALQNNRSIQNAHHETLFPSNFNGNNEMSSQEYSQILADLFERQQGHSGPPPTDKNELSKLPQLIFSEEDLKDEKQCAVCKELFQEDDTAVELPCSHPFHLDCILPWLTTRNTCPCCRYQLKPAEETNNRNDDNDNMSDSDDGEGDGDYEIADSESDFSSDDGDDSNTFTTSYVYNN